MIRRLLLVIILGFALTACEAPSLSGEANVEPVSNANRGTDVPFEETGQQRDARMKWWREARFGIFIHWGLFSAAGCSWKGQPGTGCWMQSGFKIPADEYAATLMPQFTGERFDPDFIAKLAQETGMKYIVPITKHHEGFCLFDSKFTDFKISNTPAKRDWIQELAEASRKRGLKVGFYYSQSIDWHHVGGGWAGDARPPWYPAQPDQTDRYVNDLVIPQLKELLTRYGDVSLLWFDIPTSPAMTPARARRIAETVRTLRPEIVMNNRLGPGVQGDYQTPEQTIPPNGIPGCDWETCQTMNQSWEYTHYDRNWKSTTTLIRELIDTVSKGGNYLLNIGPKPDGTVPQSSIDTLQTIGGWMKVHGDSIYGTTASPFPKQLSWGRCTQKKINKEVTRLYLHIFKWPFDSVLRIPALENEIVSASLLSEPGAGPLAFARDPGGDVRVRLPLAEPNDYATVIALDVRGTPSVVVKPIAADAAGILTLDAGSAILHAAPAMAEISGAGESAQSLHVNTRIQALDSWFNLQDYAAWPVLISGPGRYHVDVILSCKEGEGGCEYEVELGPRKIAAVANATSKTWADFRSDRVGVLAIDRAGRAELVVRLLKQTGKNTMKLRSITLIPVEANR